MLPLLKNNFLTFFADIGYLEFDSLHKNKGETWSAICNEFLKPVSHEDTNLLTCKSKEMVNVKYVSIAQIIFFKATLTARDANFKFVPCLPCRKLKNSLTYRVSRNTCPFRTLQKQHISLDTLSSSTTLFKEIYRAHEIHWKLSWKKMAHGHDSDFKR